MALADLVVVMNDGRIEQAGTAARGVQRAGDRPSSPASSAATTSLPAAVAPRRVEVRRRRSSPIRADRIAAAAGHDAARRTTVAQRHRRARSNISASIGAGRLDVAGARRRSSRRRAGARASTPRRSRRRQRCRSVVDARGRARPRRGELQATLDKQGDVKMATTRRTAKDVTGGRRESCKGAAAAARALRSAAARSPASRRSGRRTSRTSRCASSAPACRTSTRSPTRCKAGPRLHAADDGARFRRGRPARGDAAELLRHRRHRVLDRSRRSSRPASCSRWTPRRSSYSTRSCRSSPTAS